MTSKSNCVALEREEMSQTGHECVVVRCLRPQQETTCRVTVNASQRDWLRCEEITATPSPVKRLKTIIALFMLAVWVPGTSHALLEAAGVIHQPHASSADDDYHDHDAADGFCVLPSAAAPSVKNVQLGNLLYLVAPRALESVVTPTPFRYLPSGGLGASPPLLPKSWQFLFRTALHGRAPSFLA
jgi:hypothetical protein